MSCQSCLAAVPVFNFPYRGSQAADLSHDVQCGVVGIIGGLRAPFTVGASARVHLRPMAPVDAVTSKSASFARHKPILARPQSGLYSQSPVRYTASTVSQKTLCNNQELSYVRLGDIVGQFV